VGAANFRTERSDPTDRTVEKRAYSEWLDDRDPGVVANALICLIHQANYLLDQQLRALEREFIEGGGYSERLAAARLEQRRREKLPDRSDQSDLTNRSDKTRTQLSAPSCQACGKEMVLRTARKGGRAGSQFCGCTGYPQCKSTLPV
jgi:restriction system protein